MPPLLWFTAALVPMVLSQIVRLQQTEAIWWIFWDMSGRATALLALAVIPEARKVAFTMVRLKVANWEIAAWILSLFVLNLMVRGWMIERFGPNYYHLQLGAYPVPSGPLRVFDLVCGLSLVAFSEEVIFRRSARYIFGRYVGDGITLLIVSSVIFAAYHWWTGVGNILFTAVFGMSTMLLYLRSKALTPVVLLHYMVDFRLFAAPL